MDVLGKLRSAKTTTAIGLLLVISIVTTITLHKAFVPSSEVRSRYHETHTSASEHSGFWGVQPDSTQDISRASSNALSNPTSVVGTLPPGRWVWNDVKLQGSTSVSSTLNVDASGTCSGCKADTSGECKHHFLPLCFKFNATTGACPSETTLCKDGVQPPKSAEKLNEPLQSRKDTFVFVTGSSANHFCPLLNLLRSLNATAPEVPVIVYDLQGQAENRLNRSAMQSVHSNILRTVNFDYENLPAWVNINNRAGEYAWKPLIIKQVVDEMGSALWIDSGNLATQRLEVETVQELVRKTGFYSPKSPQTPWHWVHPGTFGHYGLVKCCADASVSKRRPCCCCGGSFSRCDPCEEFSGLEHANASFWLKRSMCNGALVGFQRGTVGYSAVLVPWAACAQNRSCIAPLGPGGASHRGNHRQDQAALTMLSHLTGMPCTDKELRAGFKLHQDNRWTNLSFCETVLGVSAVPSKSQTHSEVVTTTPALDVTNKREPTSKIQWAPKKPRSDVLTAECLRDTLRSESQRATTMTHVINPFPTTDVHFHWTFSALAGAYSRAQEEGMKVEVIAVTFSHEVVDYVPDFITVLPIIWKNRSAGMYLERLGVEYDREEIPLRGPIVSDVWQAAYDYAKSSTLIWTNYDLIVGPEFYVDIARNIENPQDKLKLPGLVGYSSLRLDLIIPRDRFPTLANWTVDDFFSWNNTRPQAGHDTFVFPRHWIPCLEMAHMAFGVGGWDHAIYSQMKWLATLEQKQFRTLSPGKGLPEQGLIRHIGSQIANTKKVWTNPVSWKGPARIAQYNFNKRCKAAIEIFLKFAFAGPQFCRKKIYGTCDPTSATTSSSLASAPNNDYRLVGLAVCDPQSAAIPTMIRMTGYRVELAHRPHLTVEERNTALMIVTHAVDLYSGPKPTSVLSSEDPPSPGKKGRILRLRAVAVVLDEPVSAVVEMARRENPEILLTKKALTPYVDHYVKFWTFWTRKAQASGIAVEIFNLALPNASDLILELSILQQFTVYHRCGPSQQRECTSRSKGVGICCAATFLSKRTAIAYELLPDVRSWIQAESADAVSAAHEQWAAGRGHFPWPKMDWSRCCPSP